MNKFKITAILAVALILAVCLGGCSNRSAKDLIASSASLSSSAAAATASPSSESAPVAKNTSTASALTTPEHDRGPWDLIRLDYTHKEGSKTVVDGRYEGDGVLTITESGYDLVFKDPGGNVILESSGLFTTGAQATFIGDSTISGYPVAKFGGYGTGIVMKFTDQGETKTISVMGAQR